MRSLHIAVGLVALAAGAVALYAVKGAKLHRRSGMIFVCAMLFVSASGAAMAALKLQRLSILASLLTFYLVTTALLAVRRRVVGFQWIDLGAMLVALSVGIASVQLGLEALGSATGNVDGLPAAPGFVFGAVALLAALLDIRMMARGLHGAHRIARHLWRMCFALLMPTAASFFLAQPRAFPEPLQKGALLAIPVLLVLVLMFFWLARVLLPHRHRRVPDTVPRRSGPAKPRSRTDVTSRALWRNHAA